MDFLLKVNFINKENQCLHVVHYQDCTKPTMDFCFYYLPYFHMLYRFQVKILGTCVYIFLFVCLFFELFCSRSNSAAGPGRRGRGRGGTAAARNRHASGACCAPDQLTYGTDFRCGLNPYPRGPCVAFLFRCGAVCCGFGRCRSAQSGCIRAPSAAPAAGLRHNRLREHCGRRGRAKPRLR